MTIFANAFTISPALIQMMLTTSLTWVMPIEQVMSIEASKHYGFELTPAGFDLLGIPVRVDPSVGQGVIELRLSKPAPYDILVGRIEGLSIPMLFEWTDE